MRNKVIKNKKIIIATFAILAFLIILRDIYISQVTFYDNWAYSVFVENLRDEKITLIMKLITALGSGLVLLTILLLMFLLYKNKKDTYIAAINISLIFILNNVIKMIVQRPRPSGYNLVIENNYSFPSGHSMVSTAFYGFIIYLIYKNVKDRKKRNILISLLFILIILICVSRIYLGVHYLSDTIGGFCFSIAYLMIFVSFVPKLFNERKKYEKEKNKN